MKNSGIYTFRAHGQIYHNIRSFGREDGKEPRHLELYFYNDDPSKIRKSLRGFWPSFVITHTQNILGVWARQTTSRTIMSH
jgi:NAD-dependent SIR2 family protein deacetylase